MLAAQIGRATVAAAGNRDALRGADAVVLALRFTVLKGVIDEIAGPLAGKLVVVPSNPLTIDAQGNLLRVLLATQRGYQTYVLDRVTEGRKPEMVRRLGATYFHSGDLGEAAAEADIIIECTGYVQMLLEAGPQHVRYRIICLTGVSAAGAKAAIDPGQLNRNMVLQNSVLFGSVNANRHHYELAAEALA